MFEISSVLLYQLLIRPWLVRFGYNDVRGTDALDISLVDLL